MSLSVLNCQNTCKNNDHKALVRSLNEPRMPSPWYFLGRNSGRTERPQNSQNATRICSEGRLKETMSRRPWKHNGSGEGLMQQVIQETWHPGHGKLVSDTLGCSSREENPSVKAGMAALNAGLASRPGFAHYQAKEPHSSGLCWNCLLSTKVRDGGGLKCRIPS